MTKKLFLLCSSICLMMIFLLTACSSDVKDYHQLKDFQSGDAKWINENAVLGSDQQRLSFYDCQSDSKTVFNAASQWCYYYPQEKLIIFSNWDGETGICRLTENNTISEPRIIFTENENLRIDPSITKFGSYYYITSTLINGTVNRNDPKETNGTYTLELYRSKDLKVWDKVSTISHCSQNTEDVDIMSDGDLLRVNYEKETIDRGPSQLITVTSSDGGLNWTPELAMVNNGADNEMAALIKEDDRYYLFYSSDLACPGESYSGASLYLNQYDTKFNLIRTD